MEMMAEFDKVLSEHRILIGDISPDDSYDRWASVILGH
jgi:hypothetical protein